MPYDTLMCTLHLYTPSVRHVARHGLFFDAQVLTLLFGEYTLYYVHVFQQYLQHSYMCIHVQWDAREALHAIVHARASWKMGKLAMDNKATL